MRRTSTPCGPSLEPLALAIEYHFNLKVFATDIESQHGRPKLPTMFMLDALGSLGMCTKLDKNDTKSTASGLCLFEAQIQELDHAWKNVFRSVPLALMGRHWRPRLRWGAEDQ